MIYIWPNNSLFCFVFKSGQVLISLSFFEGKFCWIQYSWLTAFSCSPLNISPQSLLAGKVSAEKPDDYLLRAPLYMKTHFSFAAFKDSVPLAV